MPSILERNLDLVTLHEKPVIQKAKQCPKPQKPIEEIAQKWISEFNDAISSKDADAVAALFQPDGIARMMALTIGWWRDVLSMSWEFHTYQTTESIKEMIQKNST